MYNNFKKLIGEYDSVNEFIELMVRDFHNNYKSELADPDFLKKKSAEHNIMLTSYKTNVFFQKISTSYIVSVQQCFETFLKEVNDKGKKLGSYNWKTKEKDESWLHCIINNVLSKNEINELQPLIQLCEYYRIVRNSAVHDFYDKNDCGKEFENVSKYSRQLEVMYNKLNAPNKYEQISFDDFIIFTRAAKDIAYKIYNSFKYDIDKILQETDLRNFYRYKNNTPRLKGAIKLFFRSNFNFSNETMDLFVEKAYNYIIAR